MSGKRPAFQFYPGDWRKDPGIQACGLAARGLWIEMLCLMHESSRRGYLELNGRPVTTDQLARQVGGSSEEITLLLQELEHAGVFSRDEAGTIYSRRMDRDNYISAIRSEAGRRGAEHGHKGGRPRQKEKPQKRQTEGQAEGQNNPPSSSSSTSVNTLPESGGTGNKSRKKSTPETDPLFAQFWTAYPRKAKKLHAAKSFSKLTVTPELLAVMLAAIGESRQSEDWTREEGRFIPHPSSWLNQRRWEDERPNARVPSPAGPHRVKLAGDNPSVANPQQAPSMFGPEKEQRS